LPYGFATVLMMRAYMRILTPRPPGNIHARQHLKLLAGIAPGEEITTELECAGKELKRERRYVELACRATGKAGRPLFDGRMTIIWAA
jgi:acyl dehydratase